MESRAVFDTLKGIGILEVVLHHSLSHGARKFVEFHSPEWWILKGLNRVLHFAIPMFLLVSAILLTRSVIKRPDWARFFKRRLSRTLWPYLLWCLFYWMFRLVFLKIGSDVQPVTRELPLVGPVTGPHLLLDFPGLLRDIVWGKAFYHLYFMVVLIQMAMILPAVILAVRGRHFTLASLVGIAVGIQLVVYLLQATVIRAWAPASLIIWYVPSVLLGVGIGLDWDRWCGFWHRWRLIVSLCTGVGLAGYLLAAYGLEIGFKINSIAFNSAFSLYTLSITILLLGLAPKIAVSRFGRWVATLGRVSLPIFLIHPAILFLLSGPTVSRQLARLPLPVLWSCALVLGLSYLTAKALILLRLDKPLFGQNFRTPPPVVAKA